MASLPLIENELLEEPVEDNGIDVAALVDALKREHDAAQSEWELIQQAQELAWDFYEAKPFGNEVGGRSQIVLPDVQETVDYMAGAILKTFVSGDKVAEFEATDEADEDAVSEATEAIVYNFMRRQDGYRVLHDWCVNGLVERYSVVKTMMVTEEKVTRETVTITDPIELEGLGGEIEDIADNGDGSAMVSLKMERTEKRFVDVSLPASEFRFSPRARHEDEADYLAHVVLKTRSDLVEMGFDRGQVYGLSAHNFVPEARGDQDHWWRAESTPALQEVLLCEEYARIDIDDDGIAERIKVFRVKNEILRWADGELAIETVEEQPFVVFSPFLRPNRLVGWSLADKVMDIQLSRSTVARQLMDGMYNANMPRPIVSETGASENTMDDILSPVPGAPIRVRDASAVAPYVTAFDIGKSMAVLEWQTREREARTGAQRSAQTLDPNSLNSQTATEYSGDREDGQVRQESIARNLAEPFSRLMAKKYRLMRREADPFRVKVDGQYKLVDPSKWPEDINVNIRVGLGTGSKDKRIQARMMLAPIMAEGFANKQVEPKHLFHAVDGLVRDLGIGQGDDFWIDPEAPPEIDPQTGQPVQKPEEGPSPEMLAMQAEQQREDEKMQMEARKAEIGLQITREQGAAKIELMREEAAAKIELEREKAGAEADMNMRRMAFEMEQAREQAEFQREMARETARAKAEEASVSKNRSGGDLDK